MYRTATSRAPRTHGWIVGARHRATPAMRLFCLPYAGGGASAYAQWPASFPGDIEVCPIELPGRQTRWGERAFVRLEPLVDALASAVVDEIDVPYALFGHSMGSFLAFELARALRRRGADEPRILFVSGGPAPQLPRWQQPVHDQANELVVAKLRELGAVPEEIFAEPELLELLMPTIRADFSVVETYEHRPESPLGCPIVAFAGTEDREVPPIRMEPWREQTSKSFRKCLLPGGHFFLRDSQTALLDTVRAELAVALESGRT